MVIKSRLTLAIGLALSVSWSAIHLFINDARAEIADNITNNFVMQVDGKALLKKYCSQCHAPPSANSHKPGQWKNIILRMQIHRQRRGYKPLPKPDIIILDQFLSQTSTTDMDIKSE